MCSKLHFISKIDYFLMCAYSSMQKEKKRPQKQSSFENVMNSIRSNADMLRERGLEAASNVKQWVNKFVSSLRRKDDGEL